MSWRSLWSVGNSKAFFVHSRDEIVELCETNALLPNSINVQNFSNLYFLFSFLTIFEYDNTLRSTKLKRSWRGFVELLLRYKSVVVGRLRRRNE